MNQNKNTEWTSIIVQNIKSELIQADSKLGWTADFFGIILTAEIAFLNNGESGIKWNDTPIKTIVWTIIILQIIAMVFIAVGLWPRKSKPKYINNENNYKTIFYKEILMLDKKGYCKFIGNESVANSINIQAQIVNIKYICVKWAWGLFFMPVGLIVSFLLIKNKNKNT